jgi:hypothetical protein
MVSDITPAQLEKHWNQTIGTFLLLDHLEKASTNVHILECEVAVVLNFILVCSIIHILSCGATDTNNFKIVTI